jgi:ribosomal protein L11 methyltransferase
MSPIEAPDQVPSAGWLEVALTVDGELAEAVAEVLARYAPDGVVIHSTGVEQGEEEWGREVGPLRVSAYLPAGPQLDDARRQIEEALWYLGRIRPLPAPEFKPVAQSDWAETWKQHYHPIKIGRQLVIQPAWIETVPAGRIPVLIEPGMAFGTGTHPTTQLCLEILEDLLQPGQAVIDVGCGSGILSIAALKLGAGRAVGVDIDAAALASAAANARLNGVAERFETGTGSVENLRTGGFSLRQAPLVLANILAAVIVRLLDDGLAALVAPGGKLVLSGILEPQLEGREGYVSVLAALERHNLRVIEQRQIEDWVVLVVDAGG